jgi:hypothetical protein
MNNMWDEEEHESVSEYDLLEEAHETEDMAKEFDAQPYNYVDEVAEELLDDIEEESAFDLDIEESTVVYNARLRLEQAKLYEMLINHNLFDGVDASDQAIVNVQNELKEYIVYRLKILLGMNPPKQVTAEQIEIELPFNDIEVDFLKQLAYKGTHGQSAEGSSIVTQTNTLTPVSKTKKPNLKPLVSKPVKKAVQKKPTKQKTVTRKAPIAPKLTAKPTVTTKAPVRKKTVKKKTATPRKRIKSHSRGRALTEAEAEAIAKQDMKEMEGRNWQKMSAKEKAKEVVRVNQKHAKSSSAKSMPSFDQLHAKYSNEQSQRSMSNDKGTQFNNIIAAALAAQKNQE